MHTRRKYHWAIKHASRYQDDVKRNNAAQLLIKKSFTEFWTTEEVKKRKYHFRML